MTALGLRRAVCCVLLACVGEVRAQSIDWRGFTDLRVASSADARGWGEGGLGKSRFGDGGTATAASAVVAGAFQATPQLQATVQLQFQSDLRRRWDVLDAYLRYRPVSTTPWRWSAKLGAFFPPISMENDALGWTSPWTLTPSAIDSWVGEELRTQGAELRIEHRARSATLGFTAAAFGRNDPAGEVLASRGWAMGDLTSGLFAVLREPDVYAPLARAPVPAVYRPFVEIDDRVGWYAGFDAQAPGIGTLSLLRYDNRADPGRYQWYADRKVFAWHTRFWSLGAQGRIGDVVLLAQAMRGDTAFEPVEGLYLDTRLHAGYLMAAWDRGDWRPTVRVDVFGLRQTPENPSAPLSEHGSAVTFALNWRPTERWRFTGELLRVDSTRAQRVLEGEPARTVDLQMQWSARWFF